MREHSGTQQSLLNAFILCLNILFGIGAYWTLVYGVLRIRVPGHSIITSLGPPMLYATIIGLGVQELGNIRRTSEIMKRRDVTLAIVAYFSICLIMAVQIPANLAASGSLLVVINGLLTWLLPIVAVFGVREQNWITIRRTLRWQSAIACVCLLATVPMIMAEVRQLNPLVERPSLVELGGGVLYYGSQLPYAGTFLLSFRSLSLMWRVTAVATVGLSLWVSMIGQFRSGVLFAAAAACLGLLYIPLRVRVMRPTRVMLKAAAAWMLVLAVLFGIGSSSAVSNRLSTPITMVSDYVEAMVARNSWNASESRLPYGLDFRLQESQAALSELTAAQLVVGKGIGATWSGGTMYEDRRDMLHLGVGHLVLHGGVLLALFVVLCPASVAIYVFLASRSELPLVCAGTLCLAIVGTFVSNIFAPNLSYVLLSLCVGGSLFHFQKR
jgi:hypothetical protein